jgi:hypothetical protein
VELQLLSTPLADLDPARWDAFVTDSPQGSLYTLHGYLLALREDWEAWIVAEGDTWLGIMPVAMTRRWRYQAALQPMFTQYLGPVLAPDLPGRVVRSQAQARQVTALLAGRLAALDLVVQQLPPGYQQVLPFYWAGFTLHTRYTMVLDLGAEDLFQQLAEPLRRQINKARRGQLRMVPGADTRPLESLMQASIRAGRDVTGGPGEAAFPVMRRLAAWLQASGRGGVFEVTTPTGDCLAAGIFAQYQSKYLYLAGAWHPDGQSTGAMSYLLWEAICQARQAGATVFDFEGSMIEGVASFFARYGAVPVPYVQIQRNSLPLAIRFFQWIRGLRS